MAINSPITERTIRTREEITSRSTNLLRIVQRNTNTGYFDAVFPIQIFAESIVYGLDAEDNKTEILERKDGRPIVLTDEEIVSIWSTAVTLDDGTKTYLGPLISDKLDAIISTKFEL